MREHPVDSPIAASSSAPAAGGRWRERDWAGILAIVGLALGYLAPSPAVAVAGLAIFAVAGWQRLDLALALLPLTFPFWYVPLHFSASVSFPLSELAIGICVLVALARAGMRWRGMASEAPKLRALATSAGRWTILGAALFLLGTTSGLLVAVRPHEAFRYFRWEAAEPVIYAVLLLLYVRRRETVRVLAWSFVGAALLVALLAAAQMLWLHVTFTPLADGNRLVSYTGGRTTAVIFGSGNTVGMWIERALPLVLALALAGGAGRSRERVLAALCVVAFVPALFWSDSRGAWMGAAVGGALVVAGVVRRPRMIAVMALAAVALAVVFRDPLAHAVFAAHGPSDEIRAFVWLAALHMIRDHPLLGIGLDQFLYYYSSRYTAHPYWITYWNGQRTPVWREPNLSHAHNIALNLWLSGGILALAGFVAILWETAMRLWRVWRVSPFQWAGAAALGLAGSLAAGLAHGMVDRAYFETDLALWFWWAVALSILLARWGARRAAGE